MLHGIRETIIRVISKMTISKQQKEVGELLFLLYLTN